jgi:leader peptidase (prepilin peptidase)/N-methyltransferase
MLLPILLLASCSGAAVGLIVLTLRRQSRSTPIPFGPFLAAGGWIVLMYGPQLTERYLAFLVLRP